MIAENKTKNANFLRIVAVLRRLLTEEAITDAEYNRAKKYYQKMTGADIVVPN